MTLNRHRSQMKVVPLIRN